MYLRFIHSAGIVSTSPFEFSSIDQKWETESDNHGKRKPLDSVTLVRPFRQIQLGLCAVGHSRVGIIWSLLDINGQELQ